MKGTGFLAVACLVAAIGLSTTSARADDARVVSLRSAAETLAGRVRSVRALAEHAHPTVRRESERIIDTVEDRRVSLIVRLEILDMVGRTDSLDEATIADMVRSYDAANHLLSLVEGWYATDR